MTFDYAERYPEPGTGIVACTGLDSTTSPHKPTTTTGHTPPTDRANQIQKPQRTPQDPV